MMKSIVDENLVSFKVLEQKIRPGCDFSARSLSYLSGNPTKTR